ncbi:MAG TPA: type 4a pilus biogenesis protein PilO [Gaiellaceae bacterium]
MKKNVNLNLNLKKNGLVVVVVVCAVLVLALGWIVILSPKEKSISDLRNQTAAVRQQISDDLARAASARSAASAPTIKTADIYKLQTAMPSITDMPDLLLEIDQTAKAAGVTLTAIGPTPVANGTTGYSTEHISLVADGNFYTLTDYIYRLRNMVYVRGGALEANGRIFTVDNVTIVPNAGTALQATIQLDTYVYGSSTPIPAAATGAPPGATTAATTTTTSTTPAPSGPTAAGATP